jgi:hypothetical protein
MGAAPVVDLRLIDVREEDAGEALVGRHEVDDAEVGLDRCVARHPIERGVQTSGEAGRKERIRSTDAVGVTCD